MAPMFEIVTRPADERNRPYVRRYLGYHIEGFEPGVHRGIASGHLGFLIGIGRPIRSIDVNGVGAAHDVVVSGPSVQPTLIPNDGTEIGIDIELTPLGARALFGCPAQALAGHAVELEAVVGRAGTELHDRVNDTDRWSTRFAAVDDVIARLARNRVELDRRLTCAWGRIWQSDGLVPLDDVASDAGWSRRHFAKRFSEEFGVRPKQAIRLARFSRAVDLIKAGGERMNLSDVAAICGYHDQAHLHRDSVAFAGCAPGGILDDNLPFLQDADTDSPRT